MSYILGELHTKGPGEEIGEPEWEKYINPYKQAKWVGFADLVHPPDQQIALDLTGPIGIWGDLYYGVVAQLENWEYNVKKIDEWIEISPTHKAYYDMVMGQKEALEIKIKRVVDDLIKQVSDLELLEHDMRRYKEFSDYFKAKDEHSLKAVFVDMVDFHAGEGTPGRLSMSFMQQNNIFPTIVQDFFSMQSEDDLEKGRLKDLPTVEKNMLKTKWKTYQEWKQLFSKEVEQRCGRLETLIQSKNKMIEQSREWIKPHIARHKLLKEGLSREGEIKKALSAQWHAATEAIAETKIVIWAWKEMESPEFFKAPGELLAMKPEIKLYENGKMIDKWAMEHLVLNKEVGLKAEYPWITEKWVHEKTKEIMEKDDWFKARKRVHRPYLYYNFLEIEFSKWNLRSATGAESEDVVTEVYSYWMSQNVLLVKLLELKAKQEGFERYVDELIGMKKSVELVEEKTEKPKTTENIMNRFNQFYKFFGFAEPAFRIFKKGPYEKDFKYRITKFYLTPMGRNYYGPVDKLIRNIMKISE